MTKASSITPKRMVATPEGDLVVFLFGLRINTWWKVHQWLPLLLSIPKIFKQLKQNPELGFLGHEQWWGRTCVTLQYWQSLEQLQAFAKDPDSSHLTAWAAFNRKIGKTQDVGLWHETYVIKKDQIESVYNKMPAFGLAKAVGSREQANRNPTS